MTHTKHSLVGALIAVGIGLTAGVSAQDDTDAAVKEKMLTDPMTRAELQCVKLRADAATGTDDQKRLAEMKCAQAIEWAKEMVANNAKKKPKPVPEADPNG